MTDTVIRTENLGKRYRIGTPSERPVTLAGRMKRLFVSPFDYLSKSLREPRENEAIWALRDVSIEIGRGEVVGIIGKNGAGKSTLLRILSSITEPTRGRAELNGRVGSLLEVGTGFHPELTGRENIYLNGAILGMKRAEIAKKFDEIVAFAETEKFLDTQIKRYSSGMYVRLAFAVAAHLETEILLIDEVLAVGDAEFRDKCLGKMKNVSEEGRTVLFVSHNMAAVQEMCPRCLWMANGRIQADGPSADVVYKYVGAQKTGARSTYEAEPDETQDVSLIKARIPGFEKTEMPVLKLAEPIVIETDWRVGKETPGITVALFFRDSLSRVQFVVTTEDAGLKLSKPGFWRLKTEVVNVLMPGEFQVDVVAVINRRAYLEEVAGALAFKVASIPADDAIAAVRPTRPGLMFVPSRWDLEKTKR